MKKIGYKKLWIIFIIASVFGCYFEMIKNLIEYYFSDGIIFWERRSGLIYGPFSIIYGFGAVFITIIFINKKWSNLKIFLLGGLLCGIFEYIINFLQEKFIGTVSWDYSDQLLNINGRTTIPIMIAWGLICLIFIKILYPFIFKVIDKIPKNILNISLNILIVFLIIDMFISFSALIRQFLRHNNVDAITFYGDFLDKYYPDERLKEAYPNMVFKED